MNYIKYIDVIERRKLCLCAPRMVFQQRCALLFHLCRSTWVVDVKPWANIVADVKLLLLIDLQRSPIGNFYIPHLTTISSLCYWLLAKHIYSLSLVFIHTFIAQFEICTLYTFPLWTHVRIGLTMKNRTFMKCINNQVKITLKSIYRCKMS